MTMSLKKGRDRIFTSIWRVRFHKFNPDHKLIRSQKANLSAKHCTTFAFESLRIFCGCLVATEDYIPVIQMVYFPPFSKIQTVQVTIRDDQGLPKVEGTEEFELVLRTPINAGLGQASETVVAIDDSISDCEFLSDIYCMYMFLYKKI